MMMLLKASAIAASVGVVAAPVVEGQNFRHFSSHQVVELGVTPVSEDASNIGQNIASLPDGGFAAVWVRAVIDFAGVATAGTGLLQFVSPYGKNQLPEPLVVVESTTGGVWSPAVASDGRGGVFAAFVSTGEFIPGPGFTTNLTLQRVNDEGDPLWPGNGVVISDDDPNLPVLVEEGSGGVYVCFAADRPSGRSDIFCQLTDSTGHVAWGDHPLAVALERGARTLCRAISDDAGGIIVVWVELLENATEIRAQRFDTAGIRHWGDTGVKVAATDLATHRQGLRMIGAAADGTGGVVVSYEDDAEGTGWERRVSVQRIDSLGLPVWSQPVQLGTDGENSRLHEATVADGSGTTYVVSRVVDGSSVSSCRVDRVTLDGLLPWGREGVALAGSGCVRSRASFAYELLSVVVATSGGGRVFTVLPNGSLRGSSTGYPSGLPDDMIPADVAWSATSGRVLSVWESSPTPDVFNTDVLGVVHRLVLPAPRQPRQRAGVHGPDATLFRAR